MAPIQTSVLEFLQTGWLSNGTFFFHLEEESEGAATPPELQKKRIVENAARLALLLTRSFVHTFDPESAVGDDLNWLSLGDFLIEFEPRDDNEIEQTSVEGGAESLPAHNRFAKIILLLGIQNSPPTPKKIEEQQGRQQQHQKGHSKASTFQILGGLLYSIFSFSQCETLSGVSDMSFPLTYIPTSPSPCESGESESECSRSTKSSRVAENTLFSLLLERNNFPLSICRLLSDMIDTGPKGKARKPFISFTDIMEDLGEMISRPQIFLHDSHSPHGKPVVPTFGRTFCGRREEFETLMEIAKQMEELQASEETKQDSKSRSEVVFVSGIAGSGKSRLVHPVAKVLSRSGWIVTRAKFGRGRSYASGGVVSAMFDEVVSYVVKMKDTGQPADVSYSERVSKSILNNIGKDQLSGLVRFLPSLSLLLGDIDLIDGDTETNTGWQLVYSLSKIIESVLDMDRFIMICCDDLQWADKTSLQLITEVVINLGNFKRICRRCLFVGMYRSNEVDDDHPFAIQQSLLQMSQDVNTTEIGLSSLSRPDIDEILMVELKLPRRIVADLSDSVHKKTSGHALYVVELLNSLLNDALLTYSPQKCQYDWDMDRIDFIRTSDNVAEFIALNLSSLTPESHYVLQILSCFGIQTDINLLKVLEKFQEGMVSSVKEFLDRGILDQAGPILMFTHDLILQTVNEGMPLNRRRLLHLRIGEYIGTVANTDVSTGNLVKSDIDISEQIFYAGNLEASSLITLACDQIDFAGVDYVIDDRKKIIFSKLNLSAGQKMANESNYSAALYYLVKGISFLIENPWQRERQLCTSLYTGAIMAAFAMGRSDIVTKYADVLIEHEQFEDTLEIQIIVLRSLRISGAISECVSRGFGVLRQVNIDIPTSPTDEMGRNAMAETDRIALKHNMDGIANLCKRASDYSVHNIFKIIDAFYDIFSVTGSPIFPLLTCELVKYSFQNRVYQESAAAFAMYGMLKIAIESDYEAAKMWADASRAVIKYYQGTEKAKVTETRAAVYLLSSIDIWFVPLRDLAPKLMSCSEEAMAIGSIDHAISCMAQAWICSLYGGEQLSIISASSLQHLQLIARHSNFCVKWTMCDYILLAELTGKPEDYFSVLEDSISSLDDIEAEAISSHNYIILVHIHQINLVRSFWKGDYVSAEEHSHKATMVPNYKFATMASILDVFFGCLVHFQLYRELGGDDRLKEAIKKLEKMERWSRASPHVFAGKFLLLKAEYLASINENHAAEESYIQSISSSRDHGNVHELALAYELLGKYYSAHGSETYCKHCFKQAHVLYIQWGATMVAKRLEQYGLDLNSSLDTDLHIGSGPKHVRQRD
mmetsp:Transcript_4493/g.9952  ORF Transcript_4493/g.9952 Transcript_4493/m.9952 type:complete len:1333 (+) Transcript_4493:111-4109(+)|eukprot:CAMPEP_0183729662 /NCGR_PEP_ID=MMETSP0737-20130205/30865_1 /TAXON_ID=385413 /ORGANISM="Thalassiosira miniscula, Strain CCMP1093" /LENGTH=1332 /DNA_ID=CAMNT_0025961917 /DNA_START=96 /DNA_END=4094 /DNA_ORIENTATION=+